MNIIACQYPIAWESPEENFSQVQTLLNAEAIEPGSLIILPEMFASGFSMNVASIADGPGIKPFLQKVARKYQSWIIAGYVSSSADGRGLNLALIYDPDGTERAAYTKIHPFSYAGEDKVYAPGTDIELITIEGFCVCPFICYDLRFPEVFRTATVQGADTFVVIANWPAPRTQHWTRLLQARAIENQAYVIGVNRTGKDPKLSYDGASIVVDPQGETVASLGHQTECLRADLHREQIDTWRKRFPALQDCHHRFTPPD